MKIVKIVRVEKGNEATGAEQVAAFYNEMEKQGARTSRAIITSVGDDIVYTMFADKREQKNDDLDSDEASSNDGYHVVTKFKRNMGICERIYQSLAVKKPA